MATGTQYREALGYNNPSYFQRSRRLNFYGGGWTGQTTATSNNQNRYFSGPLSPAQDQAANVLMPMGVNAAYRAIWGQLTLDTAPAGPTTYYQNCYSAGSGATALARGVGLVLVVSGSGAVSSAQTLITFVVQQCYATGVATVTVAKRVSKAFVAAAVGTASVVKSISKPLSHAGTGATTLVRLISKPLLVSGTGTPAVVRGISKAFAVVASGTATLADYITLIKQALMAAVGSASSSQTFIAAPPPAPWFQKIRRAALTYIRRR